MKQTKRSSYELLASSSRHFHGKWLRASRTICPLQLDLPLPKRVTFAASIAAFVLLPIKIHRSLRSTFDSSPRLALPWHFFPSDGGEERSENEDYAESTPRQRQHIYVSSVNDFNSSIGANPPRFMACGRVKWFGGRKSTSLSTLLFPSNQTTTTAFTIISLILDFIAETKVLKYWSILIELCGYEGSSLIIRGEKSDDEGGKLRTR